jgi:hypothetical protein
VKRKGEGQGSEEDEGRGRIKVNECRVTNGLRLEMEVRPVFFLAGLPIKACSKPEAVRWPQ